MKFQDHEIEISKPANVIRLENTVHYRQHTMVLYINSTIDVCDVALPHSIVMFLFLDNLSIILYVA